MTLKDKIKVARSLKSSRLLELYDRYSKDFNRRTDYNQETYEVIKNELMRRLAGLP